MDRLDHRRVCVTDDERAECPYIVDEATAGLIPYICALAADEQRRLAAHRSVGADGAVDATGKQHGSALAPAEAGAERHSAPRRRVISSIGR